MQSAPYPPAGNINQSPSQAVPQTLPPDARPPAPPAPSGRERRTQTRATVDASAFISLVKTGSRLEGCLVDLSLGGCCIRLRERFPLGIYTRAEVEFRLEGLSFRLGGVIQTIHDKHTVGIRFLDMSERKRTQVAELMAEIQSAQQSAQEGPQQVAQEAMQPAPEPPPDPGSAV